MRSWRVAFILAFAIALVIQSVLLSRVDGGAGGSGGQAPRAPEGGGLPSGSGASGGLGSSDADSDSPTSTLSNEPTYTIPYADLVIKRFRANRDVVAPEQVVEFTIVTENVGYLEVQSVNLTLYDGVIRNDTAISWGEVDMWNFEATTTRTWVATGVGNHTIIAFIDANDTVTEISDTNNQASIIVRVANGGGPGLPDIMVDERDIGLNSEPHARQPTILSIEVRNIGDVSATNVTVRLTDDGVTIDYYVIGELSTTAPDIHSTTWVPATEGAHFINLTTDEENAIRELREDNNAAAVGIYVLPSPSSGLAMFEGEYNILPGLPVAYAEHLLGAPIPIVGGPRVIRIVGIPFPQPPPFQAAR